jgi:hypothetical protein
LALDRGKPAKIGLNWGRELGQNRAVVDTK